MCCSFPRAPFTLRKTSVPRRLPSLAPMSSRRASRLPKSSNEAAAEERGHFRASLPLGLTSFSLRAGLVRVVRVRRINFIAPLGGIGHQSARDFVLALWLVGIVGHT